MQILRCLCKSQNATKETYSAYATIKCWSSFRESGSGYIGTFAQNKESRQYNLVEDYFSKWMQAIAVRHPDAVTAAKKLVDHFITIVGVPLELHSDQGSNFESNVFKEMCKILRMTKTRTTQRRPQSDGMIERGNRTIENMLSAFVN